MLLIADVNPQAHKVAFVVQDGYEDTRPVLISSREWTHVLTVKRVSQALADGVATTGIESQGGRLLGLSTMSCQSRTSHVISCSMRRFRRRCFAFHLGPRGKRFKRASPGKTRAG